MLSFTETSLTVAEADTYHQARLNTAWTSVASSPEDQKAAAIRRGTDYIAGKYNGRWRESFEYDDVPDEVKFAIAEAALRELTTPGAMTPDLERGGAIKSIKAGSVAIDYADGADVTTTVTVIDNLLRTSVYGSGVVELVRS